MTQYHFVQAYNAEEENAAHTLIAGANPKACKKEFSKAWGCSYRPFLVEPLTPILNERIMAVVSGQETAWTIGKLLALRDAATCHAFSIVQRDYLSGAVALRPYICPEECCPPDSLLKGFIERGNADGVVELSENDVTDFVVCQMRYIIDGAFAGLLEAHPGN